MFSSRDVTIYLPFYNAHAHLEKVMKGLREQSVQPKIVLIVDDGSQPPCEAVEGAALLRLPMNQGLASARNAALTACDTALLAALDADVEPDRDWLQFMLAAMNGGSYAGVGGRLKEKYVTLLPDRWRAAHMAQNWGDYPVLNPRFLFGSNTLHKTAILRANGGYDPALRTNNEDRSISEKLYAAGHDLFYTPLAYCYHLKKDSVASVLRGYWQWHHAKGVSRGDYDAPEGLIRRIGEVNFGIFRYRYDMDRQMARREYLPVDAMIPWIFCAQDLRFFADRSARPVPVFPSDGRLADLPERLQTSMERLIPRVERTGFEAWHREYESAFLQALEKYGWNAECLHDYDLWDRLQTELDHENRPA